MTRPSPIETLAQLRESLAWSLLKRGASGTLARGLGRLLGRVEAERARPRAPDVPVTPRRIAGTPLVSIVVPTRDRLDLVRRCVESILARSTWRAFELIVVDNGSADPATLAWLGALSSPARVLRDARPFNWSALNNAAARESRGDHLLFVNDDVEVIAPGWIEALVEHSQERDVGAVGAKLLYPDGRVQHAGIVLGVEGVAGHAFRGVAGDDPASPGLHAVRECSAVTGACLMTRRKVFEALGGFDDAFRVAFNDVDYCLRAREQGLRVLYTPHAELHHRESATRSGRPPASDSARMRRRWGSVVAGAAVA